MEKVRANPYTLAKDIHGIGFKTGAASICMGPQNRRPGITERLATGIQVLDNLAPRRMPTIYRIEDSDESAQGAIDTALAAQVTFDGKRTGKVMPGEYQALLIGAEIKPLPHPLEWSTLRAHKETYLSASLKAFSCEWSAGFAWVAETFLTPRASFLLVRQDVYPPWWRLLCHSY